MRALMIFAPMVVVAIAATGCLKTTDSVANVANNAATADLVVANSPYVGEWRHMQSGKRGRYAASFFMEGGGLKVNISGETSNGTSVSRVAPVHLEPGGIVRYEGARLDLNSSEGLSGYNGKGSNVDLTPSRRTATPK